MKIINADCRDAMQNMAADSFDSIVTDPPYGLAFMGKKWDYDVPSVEIWAECLRVLKPGGHLLAFAGTRTQHRMAVRIEDAGFEIRDMIAWVYGSGFPKSLDVSKAIDKAAGRIGHATESIKDVLRDAHAKSGRTLAQLNDACGFEASGYLRASSTWANVLPPSDKWPILRDALGLPSDMDTLFQEAEREVLGFQKRGNAVNTNFMSGGNDITAPATDAAKQWNGWGTALKPAWEPIIVARKPLIGTVAENVLKHGTGAINVDGCRVAAPDGVPVFEHKAQSAKNAYGNGLHGSKFTGEIDRTTGRWPANLIHDGSDEVVGLFPQSGNGSGPREAVRGGHKFGGDKGQNDTLVGRWHGDSGSAARFFYCAKASKADRDEGCEGLEPKNNMRVNGPRESEEDKHATKRSNHHPTVKPTALMRYLCRLVTPPGGIVLDPFCGSGSTGKAAILEGFDFVGIEQDADYAKIAEARIKHAMSKKAEELPL